MATNEQAAWGGQQGGRQFPDAPQEQPEPAVNATECGVEHTECPNTWKGKCRKASHGAGESHLCSECLMLF